MDDDAKAVKRNEAARRWRANNPERARAIGRKAYHRLQRECGNESRERKKPTDAEAVERADKRREYHRKWAAAQRLKKPELIRENSRRHYQENRERRCAQSRAWHHKNKDRVLARMGRYQALKRYGLTPEQLESLVKICGICGALETQGKKKKLHVDHCHDTKKVRGLLCGWCNVGLGYFRHNQELLRKAVDYLALHAVPVDADDFSRP